MQSKARKLYDEAIVIDGLNISNWDSPNVYAGLRAGNLTAISATVATWENFPQTMDHIAAWLRRFRQRADILQVKSIADIHTAKKSDKTGIILSFQNASPIENDLDRLGLFHALGVRMIQLTYHERNLLGNGCFERRDEGLSNFGVDAIGEMNELGILIDLSHVGDRTTLEAIEVSERPVTISHANARAFYDHRRNKEDEALRLLAEKGGVVCTTPFCNFLPTLFESTLEDYIDAVDDMVERIGIDHVAVGNGLHPRPAFIVLALYRFATGHQIPVHFCGPLPAIRRAVLPAQRPGYACRISQPRRGAGEARLLIHGHRQDPGRKLDANFRGSVAGLSTHFRKVWTGLSGIGAANS